MTDRRNTRRALGEAVPMTPEWVLPAQPDPENIASFTGKYRFLSNFYPAEVRLEGVKYPTVEHAYQAAKTLDPEERAHIRKCEKAGDAKRKGKTITKRPDWDDVKLDIMYHLVRQKFEHEPLAKLLKETGTLPLIEGNTWGDVFWGVCNGKGQNHLGRILMKVRSEL